MRLETFKELYKIEREWKYKLDDVILIPIAILTGIGGVVSYIASNIKIDNSLLGYTYFALISLIFILIFLSLIFYSLSYVNMKNWKKGHDYSHPTPCNEINTYVQELIDEKKAKTDIDNELESFLIEMFTDCRDDNFKINKFRANKVGLGRLFLLSSVFLTFILSVTFIFNTMKFENIEFAKKPTTTVKVNEGAVKDGKTLLGNPTPKPQSDSSGGKKQN